MGDIFLHLGFARRLRFAEGLHPLIVETLVRHSKAVVLGATLPLIPALEKQKTTFWQRLFFRKSNSDERWSQTLTSLAPGDLSLTLLEGDTIGVASKLAMSLGALSSSLLNQELKSMSIDESKREGIERAQARLWLQQAIPNHRAIPEEWRPAHISLENSQNARLFSHVDAALKKSQGERPHLEAVKRWVKALQNQVSPLQSGEGLPPLLDVPEHQVQRDHFDGDSHFVGKTQTAVTRFVAIANALGKELFANDDINQNALRDIFSENFKNEKIETIDLKVTQAAFYADVLNTRIEHLERGRNPEPAFYEGPGEDESNEIAEAPAHTQNLSLDQIEEVVEQHAFNTPTKTQSIDLAQIEEVRGMAPSTTQQLDVSQIEEVVADAPDLATPSHTQALDISQIEEVVENNTPSTTQQLDVSQIEEVVATATPSHTQALDISQIEEVVEKSAGDQAPVELTTPEGEETLRFSVAPSDSMPAPSESALAPDEPAAALADPVVALEADAETERFAPSGDDTERFSVSDTERFEPGQGEESVEVETQPEGEGAEVKNAAGSTTSEKP